MTMSSTQLGASLERAMRHWRERGALLDAPTVKAGPRPMTIAISRERGAGGSAIAAAVAQATGWPVYDRQLVDKIAADSGVQARLLQDLDEKRPRWLSETLEGLSEEKHMSGAGFAIRLRKILLALYCHGECIVLGRGAAQVLPAARTLRVRIVADKAYRIERVARRGGISKAVAEAEVDEIDRGRTDFVKSFFHKDPLEVHGYDLTLSSSRLGEEACASLIVAALKTLEARTLAERR